MTTMYSKISEEEVNSNLWSCTVIFVLESSGEYSQIPQCIQKAVAGGKQPSLRNINPTTSPLKASNMPVIELKKKIPWLASTEPESPGEAIIDLKSVAPEPSDRLAFLIKVHILETRAEMEKNLIKPKEKEKLRTDSIIKPRKSKASPMRHQSAMGGRSKRKSIAIKAVQRKSVVSRKSVAKQKPADKKQPSKHTTRKTMVPGKGANKTSRTKGREDEEKEEEEVKHDEPIIGPHTYFIMTGFYDLDLVAKLVQLKVPVNAIIAIGEDPGTIKTSPDEMRVIKDTKAQAADRSIKKHARKSMKRKSTSNTKSDTKSAAPAPKDTAKKKGAVEGRKSMIKNKSPAGEGTGSRKSVAKKSVAGSSIKSESPGSSRKRGSKKGSKKEQKKETKGPAHSSHTSENFWKALNFKLDHVDAPDELKDIAIMCINPQQLLDLEKMTAGTDLKSDHQGALVQKAEGIDQISTKSLKRMSPDVKNLEDLVYKFTVKAVYGIPKQMRNLAYYSKNNTLTPIPLARHIPGREQELTTKQSFVSKYHSLLDLVPQTMVTIEYILYCLVEHVLSTAGTESEVSLQESIRGDVNFNSSELRSKPPLIFHKDYLRKKTMSLNVKGLDLPLIHHNIYKQMPYCKVGNKHHFTQNNVKCNNHFYKYWRSVDSTTEMPYDLFHAYVNHMLFHKMYNFQQEPLSADARKFYGEFVPIVPELCKFDPFAYTGDRFQADACKLKSFLVCQEVLSLFNFPFHSSAVLAYNYIEEMDNYALLQNLQNSYSKFQYTNYLYYPPTDSLLIWFNNSLTITDVPTHTIKGLIKTPVGLRDYYKYVQYDEALWLASQKEAIENEDNILMSNYIKTLQERRKEKGYDTPKHSLTKDVLQTPLPENKIGKGNHHEAYDLGYSRIENEEKLTVFNSIDGTKITVKVCKWVRASDKDLIITVDSYDSSFTFCRNIENQFGEKGKDDNNIGLEVKTKSGDILSYRIKKQVLENRMKDEKEDENVGNKKQTVDGQRKSQRKSMAARKSMKRKSTARASKAGRKSSAGRKSQTARKSQAARKSKAGRKSQAPRKSRASRKSQAGRKSKVGRKSQTGKRQSIKGKKRSSSQGVSNGKKVEAEGPQQIIDYSFRVTSSTGLQSFFNNKYSENYIRQEYDRTINNTIASDEDYRLYLKDGTVLVYNTNGQINTLYSNGSYLKIYEVGKVSQITYKEVAANAMELQQEDQNTADNKRKSTTGGRRKSQRKSTAGGRRKSQRKSTAGGQRQSKRKSAAPRKSTAKRQSTASKRKSTARRQSKKSISRKKSETASKRRDGKPQPGETEEPKETVMEGEEIFYYDIIQYDWISFEGNETKFRRERPKIEDKQMYRVRAAQDKRGQLYVARTDGSKMSFEEDGTLHVQYWDGTAISSTPLVEKENMNPDEMDMFDVAKETHELRKVPSEKNSQVPNSTHEKVGTEASAEKFPFTVYNVTKNVEHPSYYRVQSYNGLQSMLLPGETVVENPSPQTYSAYFGNVMALQIEQRTANIYCMHPHEEPPKHFKEIITSTELGITKKQSSLASKKMSAPSKKSLNSKKSGEQNKSQVPIATQPASKKPRFTQIKIQFLELKGADTVELLSATDSSGRTFKVFNNGSTEYTVSSLDNNPELYDHCISDFNKFFVIDKNSNGYELSNLKEPEFSVYYPYDIETFHEKSQEHEENASAKGYWCKGMKLEDLKKKTLSRYLDFPKDQWLFHMAPFSDPCETHLDVEALMQSPPTKAVLWGTRRRLKCPDFDVPQTLKRALYKYMLYQMRILKKYLQYLSIYDINYQDNINLPRRHMANIDILKLESEDEKKIVESAIRNEEDLKKKIGSVWGIAIHN